MRTCPSRPSSASRSRALPFVPALSEAERADYLRAYCHGYLKEEVWGEHIIRNLDPFRKFLEVAAQHDGKTINFAAVARVVAGRNVTSV